MILPVWIVMLIICSPILAIVAILIIVAFYIEYKNKHTSTDTSKPSKFEQTACITKDEHTTWLGSQPRRK